MSIRSDLNTVISYANSQGIKVKFRIRTRKDKDAAWVDFDNKEIYIIHRKKDPLKELIASVIHELTHLIGYNSNKSDYLEYFRVSELEEPTISERYEIYHREKEDIRKMHLLHTLLGLKTIPIDYIRKWAEFDIWQYAVYYRTGKYPIRDVRLVKLRKLGLLN